MRAPDSDAGVRVFGKAYAGVEYRPRPAVYALIDRGDGRIAIMRVNGQAFLPGGGAESGESWEETIRREVLEEMGWAIHSLEPLMRTTEFLQPTPVRTATRIDATFVRAALAERVADPIEDDHFLDWLDPADASEILTHRSHSWLAALLAENRLDG
ncbi:MAG: NUDIX domain-containing protein [Candidatus Eisenbacteria bacterium]